MGQGTQLILRGRDILWVGLGVIGLVVGFTADFVAPGTSFARALSSETAQAVYGLAIALAVYTGRMIHIRLTAPAEARRLRECWFVQSPTELSVRPSGDLPSIFCVIMDWPTHSVMTTVVAVANGVSRIFTSRGMWLLAGPAGEESAKVVSAAIALVREAHRFLPQATKVTQHTYPAEDSVRFYLRTYDDLLLIEEKAAALISGSSQYTPLFSLGNALMTEFFTAAGWTSGARPIDSPPKSPLTDSPLHG